MREDDDELRSAKTMVKSREMMRRCVEIILRCGADWEVCRDDGVV